LSSIGGLVIPEQAAVPMAGTVLVGDALEDEGLRTSVENVGRRLAYVAARLGSD
jgi:hypothetical protein